MKTSNIILIVVAGAGAVYLINKMRKPSAETTRPTTRTRAPQPTDKIDATARKVKAVKRDAQRVKAIAKKYVNPQNVKKALNFIKKVKPLVKK
jgi:hypothetical protein